jgi:hypothetical protein
MLLARPVFAVLAQGLVAALLSLQGSAAPWRDAAAWFPVYATLIDAGCLGCLWILTRREDIRLVDLIGFERARLGRDVLLGLMLILPSLAFILAGIASVSWLVYGEVQPPALTAPLPLPAALYAVLVFPLLWGFTEQMTYNGYLAPRFEAISRSTTLAVALAALPWAFQHAVMPVTFEPDYVLFRMLSPIPFSIFVILLYLRVRRLMPFAIAHWLMDGAAASAGSLWPLLAKPVTG